MASGRLFYGDLHTAEILVRIVEHDFVGAISPFLILPVQNGQIHKVCEVEDVLIRNGHDVVRQDRDNVLHFHRVRDALYQGACHFTKRGMTIGNKPPIRSIITLWNTAPFYENEMALMHATETQTQEKPNTPFELSVEKFMKTVTNRYGAINFMAANLSGYPPLREIQKLGTTTVPLINLVNAAVSNDYEAQFRKDLKRLARNQ